MDYFYSSFYAGDRYCDATGAVKAECACKQCLKSRIHCEPVDAPWMKWNQSPNQVDYDFRVASAKLAMLKDGIYLPTTFNPRTVAPGRPSTPRELFPETSCDFARFPGFRPYRYILQTPCPLGSALPIKLPLILTDGCCLNNGRSGAKGGYGFSFCEAGRENTGGCVSSSLEAEGPDGLRYRPTSNRAELRAVIAALEYRMWYREGHEALVIATDSTYVADGATSWLSSWIEHRFRKSNGDEVANPDLWTRLLSLFRRYAIHGCQIMIWHIPREENRLADALAKSGASFPDRIEWHSLRDIKLSQDKVFDF
ncbi:ribonuclease H-like domain-containing protein [Xylariomycetidae sp. FL2044]|nr:ribonuclease H-like domain-containing protein [Xylariomycetidae sp. FL2044]